MLLVMVSRGGFEQATSNFMAGLPFSRAQCNFLVHFADTGLLSRSLGYPRHMHNWPQTPLRRYPWSLARNIMDTSQHRVHVQFILDVSLCPRRTLRIQRWSLRQPEHVGADRQRGSVHSGEEIPLSAPFLSIMNVSELLLSLPCCFLFSLPSTP